MIAAAATAAIGPPLPAPARLRVSERGSRLGLSRTRIKRGEVEIEIVNFGQDPHDLVVQRRGKVGSAAGKPVTAPAVAPGGRGELADGVIEWSRAVVDGSQVQPEKMA